MTTTDNYPGQNVTEPSFEDLLDTSGFPDPEPFKAPKFQHNATYGTYVAGRERQFKTHDSLGHARRSITMTNSRLWGGGTTALSDAVIYERLDHGAYVNWVPIETYQAGAELPWRSRSSQ